MNLYQQMIIDHSKNPKGWDDHPTGCCEEGVNPMCGDEVKVCVEMDKNKIKQIKFNGKGCSLSIAAASVLAEVSKGWDKAEFEQYMDQYIGMLKGDKSYNLPSKLDIFSGVKAYPMRVKCVTFAWHAAKEALLKASQPLILSDSIHAYWLNLVEQSNASGVLISFKQTGCFGWQYVSEVVDFKPELHQAYQYGALTIYMKEDLEEKVFGTRISYQGDGALGQAKVLYEHPDMQERCGCGESFVIEEST